MNLTIELAGQKHRVTIEPSAGGHRLQLDGEPYPADVQHLQPDILSVLIDGRSYRVLFDPRPGGDAVVLGEQRLPYRIDDPRALGSRADAIANDTGARSVLASMPGRVVRIMVQVGDQIEAHQSLIVVEAMKMQNELKAPKAGVVARIAVEAGTTVQTGALLLVIE
ncbi:MAG: biotin/lipoyl-containing protein [Acidobacteriaceae bacterium]